MNKKFVRLANTTIGKWAIHRVKTDIAPEGSVTRDYLKKLISKPPLVTSQGQAGLANLSIEREMWRVSILNELSSTRRHQIFDPNSDFAGAYENKKVLTNGTAVDFDGGVNENLKSILKTSNISQRNVEDAELSLISMMRPDVEQFWKCASRSYYSGAPLYYAETSFFAGFASYFDKSVPSAYRKSLGFIIDDMGYYFDSRRESRIEKELNDVDWKISARDFSRSQSLISSIIENKITKYNKYTKQSEQSIPDDIILVIDQKRNDASIRYGGATNKSFENMLQAAIRENPGKRVFIKPHPDNQFERGGSRYHAGPDWEIIPDDVSVGEAMERASAVYTVSSQVGFEALLRKKKVVTFGVPFYAGWGLSNDRCFIARRKATRSIEELFFQACIKLSVYVDPSSGEITSMENTIDRLIWMRGKSQ